MAKFFGSEDRELVKTLLMAGLLALLIRSVFVEPFHIPSGSMKSTLLVGDYIFVTKYSYGYSKYSLPFGLPFFKGRIFSDPPERGDVAVFRLPPDPRIDFIKRVIGLPGDHIQVMDSVLYINDKPVELEPLPDFVDEQEPGHFRSVPALLETLPNGVEHVVLNKDAHGMLDNTVTYVVPEGHYFMMGDNRDESQDSRVINYVGFVPEENLIGKAQLIFFSTDGSAVLWKPWTWFTALRLNRFFHRIE